MQFLSANQVHDGRHFLAEGTVLALKDNGTIHDIIPAGIPDKNNVKHYDGIICPGFINTHCHLELSHMKGLVPEHTGLVDFALHIIRQRNTAPEEEIIEKAREADRQMWLNGIVAVGDICNTSHTIGVKNNSDIYYHSFVELIGLNPARAAQVMEAGRALQQAYTQAGLTAMLAPHAPYTASFGLMEAIAADRSITSIHNQESREENAFFEHKSGGMLKLYNNLNIPIDHFEPGGKPSLQSYLPHLAKARHLLLVHNTFSGADDMDFARATMSQGLYWCLCPNANLYIENSMPPANLLMASGAAACFGTDSLASNHGLSIVAEINTLLHHMPDLPLEILLSWATHQGASFLGIDHTHGSIAKNRAPGLNLLRRGKGSLEVQKLA